MWNVDVGFEIRGHAAEMGDVRFGSRKKGLERVAIFSESVGDFPLLYFRRSWRSSVVRGVVRELKLC